MKKSLGIICLVFLLCAGSADDLIGCGDKFLSAARGTRFQQAPLGQQETILIFANPQSDVPAATVRVSVESALQAAGYRPKVVTTASEWEKELRDSNWDLVLAGLADAEALQTKGAILPVVLNSAKTKLKEVQTRYPVVLTKAPNSQGFVRAISAALASRSIVKSD